MGSKRMNTSKRTMLVTGSVALGMVIALSTLATHRAFAQQLPKPAPKPTAKPSPSIAERAPRPVAPPGASVNPNPRPPEIVEFGACTVAKLSDGQYQFATTLTNRTKTPVSFQAGQVIAYLSRTHWRAPDGIREEIRAPAGGSYFARNTTLSIVAAPAVLAPGAYKLDWLSSVPQNGVNGVLSTKTCEMVFADAPPQPEARPDLALLSVTVNPPSGTPQTAFTFTATLKNIGHAATGAANANTGARAVCHLDGQQLGETTYLANMQPNATVTLTRSRPPGIVPWEQPHHMTCSVDRGPERVAEEREDNNYVSVPFNVQ
jgi:hypothetical protein